MICRSGDSREYSTHEWDTKMNSLDSIWKFGLIEPDTKELIKERSLKLVH